MTESTTDSKSALLVWHIGLLAPNAPHSVQLRNEDFPKFFQLAKLNKVPLLFLQTITSNPQIQTLLSNYEEKYKNTLDLIAQTSKLLEKVDVTYVLFKTLKPFPYTPSDIDVLLLKDENLTTVVKALKDQGCIPLEKDNYGTTVLSPKHKMSIDLTTQIAVSGLIYMDKHLLSNHLQSVQIMETPVQIPTPAIDLLIDAAHSVFKEQTYTLSDYYTFVMLRNHWAEASKLAKEFYLEQAFDMTIKMTTAALGNFSNSSNVSLKESLYERWLRAIEPKEKAFKLPIKYGLSSLALAYLRKTLRDPVTKNSVPLLALSLVTNSFYKRIFEHVVRDTY